MNTTKSGLRFPFVPLMVNWLTTKEVIVVSVLKVDDLYYITFTSSILHLLTSTGIPCNSILWKALLFCVSVAYCGFCRMCTASSMAVLGSVGLSFVNAVYAVCWRVGLLGRCYVQDCCCRGRCRSRVNSRILALETTLWLTVLLGLR